MIREAKNTEESKTAKALSILGALRVIVTVILSWALVVKATPPNKPVENGLELVAPGVIILLLGVPFALLGVALLREGIKAAGLAFLMDLVAMALIGCVSMLARDGWVGLVALPFVVDAIALRNIVRKSL